MINSDTIGSSNCILTAVTLALRWPGVFRRSCAWAVVAEIATAAFLILEDFVMKKKFCYVIRLVVSFAMLLTSCSSGSSGMTSAVNSMSSDYMNGLSYESAYSEYAPERFDDGYDVKTSDRKLVRTASLSCEVKEYDGFIAWLENSVSEYGGYVENFSESQSKRYSSVLYYSDYRNDFYNDIEAGRRRVKLTKSLTKDDICDKIWIY